MNQTWFRFEADRGLIEKIVEVQSKATDSEEFHEEAKVFLESNTVPPMMIDFWFHGCRTCVEQFNFPFLSFVVEKLEKFVDGKVELVSVPDLANQWEGKEGLHTELKPWTLETKERENLNGFEVKEFLPHVEDQVDMVFHSLTTQVAFDSDAYKKEGKFHLHPSCQVPCNNRDVRIAFVSRANYDGSTDYGMFEFVTNQFGTEKVRDDKWYLSEGHFILTKRVRRANVRNDPLRKVLSPYTHMLEIQAKGNREYDRFNGTKTLGDHVGVAADYASISDLFTVLTVS